MSGFSYCCAFLWIVYLGFYVIFFFFFKEKPGSCFWRGLCFRRVLFRSWWFIRLCMFFPGGGGGFQLENCQHCSRSLSRKSDPPEGSFPNGSLDCLVRGLQRSYAWRRWRWRCQPPQNTLFVGGLISIDYQLLCYRYMENELTSWYDMA